MNNFEKNNINSDLQERFNKIKNDFCLQDYAANYIDLEKSGDSYLKGACPFEDTIQKSFTISIPKQIFYCFSCHKGGDIISFLTFLHKEMTPREAVDSLKKNIFKEKVNGLKIAIRNNEDTAILMNEMKSLTKDILKRENDGK